MNTHANRKHEQKGEAEYVRANQDHIYKIEIDHLCQRIGGLCAKTIPENIPVLFHTKCGPAVI